MIEPRAVAGQSQNQFFGFLAEKDRRPRQAVVNRRARDVGQGKAGSAVLVVDPDHAIAVEGQPMRQRMAPAETQADVDLDRAAAVQAGEFEGQHAIEHGVGQGQQFFAGDHRHWAAIGTGFGYAVGGIAVGVFRLVGGVVVGLVALKPCHALGFFPREWRRIRHAEHHRVGLTNVQRNRRCRLQLNLARMKHQRLQRARMLREFRR